MFLQIWTCASTISMERSFSMRDLLDLQDLGARTCF